MSTVLIVDRTPSEYELISETLAQYGWKAIEVNDGQEAIAQIQKECPDLVITDLVIPCINGYEICLWLKNNYPAPKKIPAIVCSTRDGDFERYWAKKKGADAYLVKPFQTTKLLETIQQFYPLQEFCC